jgi:Leucine-rich repeat (LRR) protein
MLVRINVCCRGSVPSTLSSLVKLQWLLLDNNQLTGALPAFLGDLPALKQAQLQHNSFSGPVPAQWCSGQATYHVAHNNLLCGENLKIARQQLAFCRFLHAVRSVSAQ